MGTIEEIKSKYIRRESTREEEEILLKWLKEYPEERKAFYQEKDIWDAYALETNSKNYSPETEIRKLQKRIDKPKTRTFAVPEYLKVAAVFALAFVFSWFVQSQFGSLERLAEKVELRKVVVPKGQINQVFLADGSRIWINSESTIEVPSVFTGDERVVTLSGEAFFEVAEDADHPFKVKVEGQTIEVLGTSFNVRAYPDAAVVQTTLKTGKIELQTQKETLTLSPGYQTELNKLTGELALKKVNSSNFDSWKEGRYEFIDADLVDVFQVVERWYDVDLVYNEDDFKQMNYSGVIKKTNSAQHFLTLLGLSIPIRYEIELEKITIEKIK
ncbi:FecR family protein [Sunxiuqinia sp. sy24]|uniref:FecR family protein n=1 Tax=Sunxiuqinia sp. sy24 TaxID=3461495 RepID=UPI00404621C2